MTPDTGLVRRIPGPFVTRVCVRTETGYRWAEQVNRPRGRYLHTEELRALGGRLAAERVPALIPRLRTDGTAVWPPVPTPALLCDELFASDGGRDARWWREICTALGRYLARIHRTDVSGLPVVLPGRGGPPCWLADDPEAAEGVARARRALPLHAAPELARDAAGARGGPAACLVHGRFSTGMLLPGRGPVALGWREAGLGDPLRDIAYLLGEFVEAAGMRKVAADGLTDRIGAFLAAYQEAAGEELAEEPRGRLRALIADRIVDHYAHGSWAFGVGNGLAGLLAGIERRWCRLRAELRSIGA